MSHTVSDVLSDGFSLVITKDDGLVGSFPPIGSDEDVLNVIDNIFHNDGIYSFTVRGTFKEYCDNDVMVKDEDDNVVMYIVTRYDLNGLKGLDF